MRLKFYIRKLTKSAAIHYRNPLDTCRYRVQASAIVMQD